MKQVDFAFAQRQVNIIFFLILTHLLRLIDTFCYTSIIYNIFYLHVEDVYNFFSFLFLLYIFAKKNSFNQKMLIKSFELKIS